MTAIEARRKRRKTAAGAAAWALVALVAGCGRLRGQPAGAATAEGSAPELGRFAVSSPVLGNRSVAPTECASGERQVFFGADFLDPTAKTVVRLAVDPLTGPAARLFAPDQPDTKSVLLQRSDCTTFRSSIEKTSVRIGGIRVLLVSLDLDCKLPDGTAVRGSVAATCP